MSRVVLIAVLVAVAVLASVADAQSAASVRAEVAAQTLLIYPNEGVRFHFEKTGDWPLQDGTRGFAGVLIVRNGGDRPFKIESLRFDFPGTVHTVWGGPSSSESGVVRIRPEEWNAVLQAGEARSFSMLGEYSGEFVPPSEFSFIRQVVNEPRYGPPLDEICSVASRKAIIANWLEPDGSRSFVVSYLLTNDGQVTSSWFVALDDEVQVEFAWDTTFTRAIFLMEDDFEFRYLFRPEAWNGEIEPGGSITFGLKGRSEPDADLSSVLTLDTCPDVSGLPGEHPVYADFRRKWATLTPENRRDYAAGRIWWNMGGFMPSRRPFTPSN